ncbi:hypothetical protein [Streptomyces sp. NPDC057694]|uniref:hypothetical protein n=1 Tax=Streptomyces sp. NPDC057694 TaxID=3346216 RepID=UPI0036C2969F
MAVRLQPDSRYRVAMEGYVRDSSFIRASLAEYLGLSRGMLDSYLDAVVIPDPEMFLRLRKVLGVPLTDKLGLDHAYVQLLARSKFPRGRTSSIQDRHVVALGEPDPLAAQSAVELVEKLREVHRWALCPSLRELECRTGGQLKRATVGDMLHARNTTVPRFDRYALFLEACGVSDLMCWISAWRRIAPATRMQEHRRALYVSAHLRVRAS